MRGIAIYNVLIIIFNIKIYTLFHFDKGEILNAELEIPQFRDATFGMEYSTLKFANKKRCPKASLNIQFLIFKCKDYTSSKST